MGAPRGSLAERFARYYVIDLKTGCWPWIGYRDAKGYGRILKDGISTVATQVSLEVAGLPKPSDKPFACHSCDNPPCVNPAHLWWGTPRDNMQDMLAKGRGGWQRETCPRGHRYDEQKPYPSETWRKRCRVCHDERRVERSAQRKQILTEESRQPITAEPEE